MSVRSQIFGQFKKESKYEEKEERWYEEMKFVSNTQRQREERNKKAGKIKSKEG
jgi:hypothetical protein